MSIVKLSNNGVKNATAFGSITGLGSMIFIKKLTASSSATLSFVDGSSDVVLDDTYKEYFFTFKNIHPATNGGSISFQASTDGGSNYNTTHTSTYIETWHTEDDSSTNLQYATSMDLAQSTDFHRMCAGTGNDNDQCSGGYLHLFNPSSTTFVKHFVADFNETFHNDTSTRAMSAGYFNTTSAINAIQFKNHSGNIDAGDICLYGIA